MEDEFQVHCVKGVPNVHGKRVLYKDIEGAGVLVWDEAKSTFAITYEYMGELTLSGLQAKQCNSSVVLVTDNLHTDIHNRLLKHAYEFMEDVYKVKTMKQRIGDLFRRCVYITASGTTIVHDLIYLGEVDVDSDNYTYGYAFMGKKHLYLVYKKYTLSSYTGEVLGVDAHKEVAAMVEQGVFEWKTLTITGYEDWVYNKTSQTTKLDKYLGHVGVVKGLDIGEEGYYRMNATSYRLKPNY